MTINELIQETEEIKNKKELLKQAETTLKQEFVGIDNIIEGVLLNMRPWFLYPELQDKPLVINLFGMTGSGKTSLVKRLLNLLDLEGDMVYFNFAEIGEMKSWEIEDILDDQISNEKTNRVFVYDEFQYASTLNSEGEEKDNKSGLKPFWEILDSGVIHKRTSKYDIQVLKRLLDYADRINSRHPIILKNGVWQNAVECLMGSSAYDVEIYMRYFEMNISDDEETPKPQLDLPFDDEGRLPSSKKCQLVDYGPFFIKDTYLCRLYDIYEKNATNVDKIDMHKKFMGMNYEELSGFMKKIIKESEKGYDMNFANSIVFVLANIDEAYQVSFNVDPDMLPDQFNKITKKLTIVDIKEALKRRFRNEQIARLGNIIMIYPSFSEDSFRKIIDLLLDRHKKAVYDKWGLNIEFDQSIKDYIYSDAVFPTHGTRPVISAVHEIVKTKLPLIVDNLNDNNVECAERIVYFYENEKILVRSYCDGVEVNCLSVETTPRLNNHRKIRNNKGEQVLVATHESGHFIMYTKLFGKLPEKVCSSTISKGTGGFMLHDADESDRLDTREDLLNEIKVCLGGYVAEGLVFGNEKRSLGASEDLAKATKIASRIVRDYGMTGDPYVSTYLPGPEGTMNGGLIRDDSQSKYNDEIKRILSLCEKETEKALMDKDWKEMFKSSAKYLTENINMPKEVMEQLYARVPEEKKTVPNEEYYINALNAF